MSYCRFSSDNFACDLYCYEDYNDEFITHVASNRVLGGIPKLPVLTEVTAEDYVAAHRAQSAFLQTAEHVPIGLPEDGKWFSDPDIESFRDRLAWLISLGYNVPDYVLPSIDAEIAAQPAKNSEGVE